MQEGQLDEIETMLYAQSHILQAIMERCVLKMASLKWVNEIQIWTNLALKAQNQCRATLATLATLRHPKNTVLIQQQNSQIRQQINQVSYEGKK